MLLAKHQYTKEDKGKPMICVLHILWLVKKGTSWDETMLSSEEIAPIAIPHA